MKDAKRKRRGNRGALMLAFLLVLIFFVGRRVLLTPEIAERVRLEIQTVASRSLGEPLAFKSLRIDLLGRVVATDISLGSGDAAIFYAEKMNVYLSLSSLLLHRDNPGRLVKSITVLNPFIKVVRLEDGTWNYASLFKSSNGAADGGLPEFGVRLRNAKVVFEDRYKEAPLSVTYFEVNGLDGTFKMLREKLLLLDVTGKSCTVGDDVKASLRFDLRAGFEVKGNIRNFDLDFVNMLMNSKSFQVAGTAGAVDFYIQSAYTEVGHYPNYTWGGKTKLSGATLNLASYGVVLENISSDVAVVNSSVAFRNGIGEVAGGRATFDGSVISRGGVFLDINSEFEKVPVSGIGALKEMLPEATGIISGSASLKGNSKSPELTMGVRGEALKYAGVWLGAGEAKLSLTNSVFTADEVVLESGASKVEARIMMEVGADTAGAVALSAKLHDVQLKKMLNAAGMSLEGVEGGIVSGVLFLSKKTREQRPDYFGTFSANSFSYSGVEPGQLFASFHYSNDVLEIENMVLDGKSEKLSAKGRIVNGDELDFELWGAEVRVSSLLAIAGRGDLEGSGLITASGRIGGTVAAPSFEGTVQGGAASISTFKADSYSGEIKYADSRLDLNNMNIYAGRDVHHAGGMVDFAGRTMLLSATIEKTGLYELAQLVMDAVMTEGTPPENLSGIVDASIVVKGSFDNPVVSLKAVAKNLKVGGERIDLVSIDVDYADVPVLNEGIILAGGGVITVRGVMDPESLDMEFSGRGVSIAAMSAISDFGASATIGFSGTIDGTVDSPGVMATINRGQVGFRGVRFNSMPVNVSYIDGFLNVEKFDLTKGAEKYSLSVRYDRAMESLDLLVNLDGAGLNTLARYLPFEVPAGTTGSLDGSCRVFRNVGEMSGGVKLSGKDLTFGNYPIDSMSLEGKFEGNNLNIYNFVSENELSMVTANGTVDLDKKSSAKINVSAHKIELARLSGTGLLPEGFGGTADVEIEFVGEENDARMYGSFVVYDLEAYSLMFSRARGLFESDGNTLDLKDMKLIHESGRVEVVGTIPLREGFEDRFVLKPTVVGVGIEVLNPVLEQYGISAFGNVTLEDVRIAGSMSAPTYTGSIKISDGSVNVKGLSLPVMNVNGALLLSGNEINSNNIAGTYNGTPLALNAHVVMKGLYPDQFVITPQDIPDVYVEYGELYKGHVSVAGLEVNRKDDQTYVSGREGKSAVVTLRDGVFVIPTTTSAGEAKKAEAQDSLRMSNIVINVTDKMVIRNQRNSLRFEPTGQLLVAGSMLKPEVKGWLTSHRGHMRYLGNTFKMGENTFIGFYSLERVGMVPVFYTVASTRVSSTDITMEVSGPMVDVNAFPVYRELCGGQDELGLNSAIGVPQMSMGESGEITVPVCPRVVLLAYEDNNLGGSQLSTQQIMQKLTHTESFITGDSSPDTLRAEAFSMFTPYVGSVVEKGINLENFTINLDPNKDLLVQLEKKVYKNFSIRYERLFSRTVKETLETRYKFRNRSFLKWGIDQDNQMDLQLEYRLRF